MKNGILGLLLMAVTPLAFSATCTSTNSGNWNSASTWDCGRVPTNADDAVIGNGDAVTGNLTTTVASLSFQDGWSSSTLTVNSGVTLTVSGNVSITGANNSSTRRRIDLGTGSTGARLIVGGNLTISGNGGSSSRDAELRIGNDGNNLADVGGNVTFGDLSSNSLLTFSGAGTLRVAGNLGDGGGFTAGTGTVVFDGSAGQSVGVYAYNVLSLSKASGTATATGNLTAASLTFATGNQGLLATGASTVAVTTPCNASSAIVRNGGGYVDGNLKLSFPSGNSTCLYPVGDGGSYSPVQVVMRGATAGTLTAFAIAGNHPQKVNWPLSQSKYLQRYWTLGASGDTLSSFTSYDATFTFVPADVQGGADTSKLIAAQYRGAWFMPAFNPPGSTSITVTGLTQNFSTVSSFAFGEEQECRPPSNVPSGVSVQCYCDNFGRASLNPSTIFGANWTATASDSTNILPRLVNRGFLRLTENTANNAKAATVPGIFPASGNYISVEFRHYAYNSTAAGSIVSGWPTTGADGIAVTLSDYSIPAQPGAFGGSLGYAQRDGIVGFAGGWIGVALDEWGNYQNPTEGRLGGPGPVQESVGVRGSGSGMSGYRWIAGSGNLSASGRIDNYQSVLPAPAYYYQVVVDARAYVPGVGGGTSIAVNRDTSGAGSSYTSLINVPNIFTAAQSQNFTQSSVPSNWQVSFTGSTGGSNNIHEIGGLRICATYVYPPTGGVAANFNAIDESYARGDVNALTGHLYTKLAGSPFGVNVAALADTNGDGNADGIQSGYAISSDKTVTVQLIDDSGGSSSCNASASACSACSKPVVASQQMIFKSTDKGFKQSGAFTVNSAYSKLLVRMCEGTSCPGTTAGCSIDTFAVRPTSFSGITSSAANSTLSGTPKFKAGAGLFTMTVTASAPNYTGTPKINTAAMTSTAAGWAVGAFSPAAFPAAVASISKDDFTYGEVGNFRFLGYNPATDTTSPRGIYDDTWTAVDQGAQQDCVAGSYANTKDTDGKYGCLFGLYSPAAPDGPNSPMFGRFVPDHFDYLGGGLSSFCSSGGQSFTYMGQGGLGIAYRLLARNGSGTTTANYSASLATPYPVASPALAAEDQASGNQGCDLASRFGSLPSAQWSAGQYLFNDANADNVPDVKTSVFSRPAAPAALDCASPANAGGPFWLLDVGVQMNDADAGAVLTGPDMNAGTTGACSGANCNARRIGTTGVAYGRFWLGNAHGSEMLPLAVPAQAQYWSAGAWLQNRYDSCTVLTTPTRQDTGNGGLTFYAPPSTARNTLAPGQVIAQMNGANGATFTLVSGDARLVLRHPSIATQGPGAGNYGYLDLVGNGFGTPSWLPPGNARACFGTCGPRSPVIYLREVY